MPSVKILLMNMLLFGAKRLERVCRAMEGDI
jgi:Sec-independent protein translocase protein TatA